MKPVPWRGARHGHAPTERTPLCVHGKDTAVRYLLGVLVSLPSLQHFQPLGSPFDFQLLLLKWNSNLTLLFEVSLLINHTVTEPKKMFWSYTVLESKCLAQLVCKLDNMRRTSINCSPKLKLGILHSCEWKDKACLSFLISLKDNQKNPITTKKKIKRKLWSIL